MIQGVRGIKVPGEEESAMDGTILKLLSSFQQFRASRESWRERYFTLKMKHPSWSKGLCWSNVLVWLQFQPTVMAIYYKTMQNGSTRPSEQILPRFPVVGYTCPPFNCYGPWLPPTPHLLFVARFFFLLFLPQAHSLVFTALPISLLGILPCIIHEWHACFTRHVPTALLWHPEGVSTKPACNLLTQGAASSQLSSPITFISWTGPSPWHQVCCDHCVV